MPRIEVNGVELFHDELGSGEAIIFHHGHMGSHDVWLDLIAPRLADRFRCIVMDSRGAGDSAHPAGGYNIEQYTRDVVGMADALELERFTYVGHSMGGGIGFKLGIEHAERLDRLVLVAPIPSGGTQPDPETLRRGRETWLAPDAREQMLRQSRALRLREAEEWIENRVDRARSVSRGHFEQSVRSYSKFDVTDRLGELTTPTLVIVGAADGLAAANVQDWLRLPNATLHVFSRVGHHVPSEVPDEFAEVVADFMEHGVVNAKSQQAKLQKVMADAR